MKNHFGRVDLSFEASDDEIEATLDPDATPPTWTDAEPIASEDIDAAREILGDAARRMHYRRLHLQYRAMAAALDALDAPRGVDSHRWHERLVEFVPDAPDERRGD